MKPWNRFADSLERAWDNVTEGWSELMQRGRGALTRFESADEDDADTSPSSGSGWGLIAADLRSADDAVYVRLEAPGLNSEDIAIAVDGDLLTISGQKHHQSREQHDGWVRTECVYGRFSRQIQLPCQVEENQAEARYKKGVLDIKLPKKAHAVARRIPINAV